MAKFAVTCEGRANGSEAAYHSSGMALIDWETTPPTVSSSIVRFKPRRTMSSAAAVFNSTLALELLAPDASNQNAEIWAATMGSGQAYNVYRVFGTQVTLNVSYDQVRRRLYVLEAGGLRPAAVRILDLERPERYPIPELGVLTSNPSGSLAPRHLTHF